MVEAITKDNAQNEREEDKTPITTPNKEPVIAPLEIGDKCMITWRDGSKKLASIIERRPTDYRKRSSSYSLSSPSLSAKKVKNEGGGKSTDGTTTPLKPAATGLPQDILSSLEADQIDYYVHYENQDRRLDEWVKLTRFDLTTLDTSSRPTPENEPTQPTSSSRRSTRRDKRRAADDDDSPTAAATSSSPFPVDRSLAALEHEHEQITKVKNISKIVIGRFEVETWYFSPYPEEYSQEDTLYVCEFCLKYMKRAKTLKRHKAVECTLRSPPGIEIYREGRLSVFEVDGKEHRIYCQNLCLFAKLFLDHKTLYYDVEPFWFYIITEVDEQGAHIVGYFSKEKVSAEDYNLACILTFPQYQKCGYGKFIISLSYELSKREKKPGSPEKPLSDLGKISYRSYWTYILMTLLAQHDNRKRLSIKDISTITAIKVEDIISTLQSLNMVKFWKGQHVVYVREEVLQEFMNNRKAIRLCKGECLTWEPHSQRKKDEAANNAKD